MLQKANRTLRYAFANRPLSSLLLTLPLKMAVAAGIVVVVSMIAERTRPFFAAMVATLPVSAGPSLFFLALDHDDAFLQATLIGAMVANLASCAYVLAYANLAQRRPLVVALGGAIVCWVIAGSLLRPIPWTLLGAIAATTALYIVMLRVVEPFTKAPRPASTPRSRYALLMRATGVSCLVALVTLTSAHVGPYISAFLAVFPIVLSSLIVILHPRIGGPATAAFIASAVPGLAGFGAGLAAAAASVPYTGRFGALGIGLLVAVAWNGALALWKARRAG
jgi:uncharacterized membrane protein (GlpM family)